MSPKRTFNKQKFAPLRTHKTIESPSHPRLHFTDTHRSILVIQTAESVEKNNRSISPLRQVKTSLTPLMTE